MISPSPSMGDSGSNDSSSESEEIAGATGCDISHWPSSFVPFSYKSCYKGQIPDLNVNTNQFHRNGSDMICHDDWQNVGLRIVFRGVLLIHSSLV
jgi:hypothetical protein